MSWSPLRPVPEGPRPCSLQADRCVRGSDTEVSCPLSPAWRADPCPPRLPGLGTRRPCLPGPACDACEVVTRLSKLCLASGDLWRSQKAETARPALCPCSRGRRRGTPRAVSVLPPPPRLCSLASPARHSGPSLASSLPPPSCSPAARATCWPQTARRSGGPDLWACNLPVSSPRPPPVAGRGGGSGPRPAPLLCFGITSHPILMQSVCLLELSGRPWFCSASACWPSARPSPA